MMSITVPYPIGFLKSRFLESIVNHNLELDTNNKKQPPL